MSKKHSCCGEERATPFCPMCGKKLYEHPLSELLLFCRDSSEKAVKSVAEYRQKLATPSGRYDIAELRRKEEAAVKNADKWANQALFLEALMKYASEKELWDELNQKAEASRTITLS